MQLVQPWEKKCLSSFYQQVLLTPLHPYHSVKIPWKELYLKDETRQVTNAFKFRGTCYRLLCGLSAERVVTASSTGNHGLGLSMAARIRGLQAHIFVPTKTAHIKLEAMVANGATIIKVDGDYEQAWLASQYFAKQTGATYISGFDDYEIITGNTSLFSEIEAQHQGGFDVVFVPVGGGGLLAACLQFFQKRNVKVVGVELDSAPALSLSLAQGKRVILEHMAGRAEELLIRQIGAIPFQIAQQAQNLEMFLVSEAHINQAIRLLWQHNGIRAERAGAASVAAALHYPLASQEQKAVAIVSGGNIDEAAFQEALESSILDDRA
ncbi:pyridoxal-phosphate dependent enzyme [Ktedonosporobacter rubrisoli]|uniref:Pyridoxal-phosphate dependent enzyme n=1 Tax=Ktedonosporobacter rubrisoli TaxID=2509675 RepID=A0A4P6JQF9_KTERU|nr:pyridoxal-phosphate dependent enzyme [Ktedonosporobacter rubrisoli]QBD77658.1 pyridoxal-phosphate dependent enzyme [Ktedonosporobacter rubrisoli]